MLDSTLEAAERVLYFVPVDHSQAIQLHQLRAQPRQRDGLFSVAEPWRRYREYIEPAWLWSGPWSMDTVFRNVLELVCGVWIELLRPPYIQQLPSYVENAFQEDPRRCVIWGRPERRLSAGDLSCTVHVSWIFHPVPLTEVHCVEDLGDSDATRQTSIMGYTSSGYQVLLETQKAYVRFEAEVCFCTESQRLDIVVAWEKDWQQLKLSRKVEILLHPHTKKRLYLPSPWIAPSPRTWEEDTIALLCFYLVQAGLARTDTDQPLGEFLWSYLEQFPGAKEPAAPVVLPELRARYRIPRNRHAWRAYVRDTIRHLVKNPERAAYSYVLPDPTSATGWQYMIPAVAERLGISKEMLYRLVKSGKVWTETRSFDGRQYQIVPTDEIDRLQRQREQKQERQALIHGWATARGISRKSALRWLERQEENGVSREAIRLEIKDALQRRPQDADP